MAHIHPEPTTDQLLRQRLIADNKRKRTTDRVIRLLLFFAFCCLMLMIVLGLAWLVIENARQAVGCC